MNLEELKKRREAKGYTLTDVANLAGIHKVVYGDIERGIKVPSLAVAKRLARILGCKIDDIVMSD